MKTRPSAFAATEKARGLYWAQDAGGLCPAELTTMGPGHGKAKYAGPGLSPPDITKTPNEQGQPDLYWSGLCSTSADESFQGWSHVSCGLRHTRLEKVAEANCVARRDAC